ncbi:sulfoxide reductase heme-binding subunit YedZ [Pasteurella canis]|uniref:Protein-methionine-sulfoxide reductase heme-binding subunit MsrQ n=1 Tax=Pasteurella canis TaxID=753 RepID=A0A379EU55_9PAST|nr:protein-methionine-sulfoxide reductase heme-binding subunit MsrQ [Pasteurella canis]SUC09939.1 sulfoxide reductase heme-binding subunit YedZ [Pasteurella canis]
MLKLLRIVIHLSCAIPFIWLHIILFTGNESQLGADPVKEMQHFLGFTAMTILLLLFVLGIVFRLLKQPQLQVLRRTLGLWAWFYVILHIYAYFSLELGNDVHLFLQELISRGYLIVGGFSFLILTLMSVSSLSYLKNKMGKWWFYLHKLGYYALLLGAIHYYWSVKNLTFSSMLYLILSILIVFWELYVLFKAKRVS